MENNEWQQVKVFQTPTHNFDESAELAGKLLEVKTVDTVNGKQKQYIILPEGSETPVMVWGSFQLNQAFEDIEPETEVKIVFSGRTDIGDGKSVKNFDVYHK